MAICGGLIFVALLFLMEETHHHFVLKRIRKSEGDLAAAAVVEAPHIAKPVFRPPWQPLKYLVEPAIAPHAAVMFLLYSTMFSALIILPTALAAPPYKLSEALIGGARAVAWFVVGWWLGGGGGGLAFLYRVALLPNNRTQSPHLPSSPAPKQTNGHNQPRTVCNLPLGLGCFIVGPFGGRWADSGARRWPASPAGRMVPGTASALLLFPVSTLVYAWTLARHVHLAVPLIASFFMGASICAFFPGVMSYVSILKQQAAAAAGGALQAMMFICGGVFIQVTPAATARLGLGGWVTLLVGICTAGAVASALLTRDVIVKAESEAGALPVTAASNGGAAAAAASSGDASSLGEPSVEGKGRAAP